MFEYQWAHGFWFASTNTMRLLGLHSSAESCENCGGVGERVSERFVFSYLMEDLLMQKAWDALLRCFCFVFFSQKRCYGDKYLVSILPSNNDVTQSCCEKAVIFTVPLYHLARHHRWIRPLLSKRNFKAGVLTAREKTIFLMLVCLAFQNVRFLPVPKYFLRNSEALPCLTQVPYKTLGNEKSDFLR